MNKTILTSLIAASFAVTAGVQIARAADQPLPNQPAASASAERGEHGHGRLMKELGLTKDQLTQIKTIRSTFRTQAQAIKDDASLNPADKKTKLKALRQQMKSQVDAILTPEQRQKLDALRAERHEAHGDAATKA
jgi:Spy/CpxP family protein refolding chaperone